MKTRRNQRGGAKAKPNHDPMNALLSRMRTLRFGSRKANRTRFGAKSSKPTLPKRSVLQTLKRKSNQPRATLRTFVTSGLVHRNGKPFHMKQFEPADYIRTVGGVLKGLGSVRERIETNEKLELLDDFDIIVTSIYEGLPKIQIAMGESKNESMNASETMDDILEEIETVGEELIEQSNEYRNRLKNTSRDVSDIQIHLIRVAEAVNQVLVDSVSELAKPKARHVNRNINSLVSHLGKMNVKESSLNDLSELLAGLGV